MQRILVPVDGSPSSNHAVDHVIAHKKSGADVEVHLLHVQPSLMPSDVPDIAKPGLAERLAFDDADHAFATAKQHLEDSGVNYTTRTELGDPPSAIALYADVHGCDEIVMGTRGLGPLKNLLMGSVAMKVLHVVKVPVTLVK